MTKDHVNTMGIEPKSSVTFSRLMGSLNVESMICLVGTIFHLVRRVATTGCGFTFSDICNHANNPHFSNQAASSDPWGLSLVL